jgi:hypothetical protein
MDIQLITKSLDEAKELITSVLEQMKTERSADARRHDATDE